MTVVGFTDDTGEQIPFAEVKAGRGIFSIPRPLLNAIMRGFRAPDHYGSEEVWSATTLINPPQIVQLGKRWDVYVSPLDNLWSTYGTLMHQILEDSAEEGVWTEERIVEQFEGVKIAGTIDRYDGPAALGQDWKVTSAYGIKAMVRDGVEKAKPEYYWQAQIYKWLLWSNTDGVAHAKDWELVTIARDYNTRTHSPHFSVVERIPIPLLPLDQIEAYIRERVTLHKAAALCEDADLPSCSDAETWQGRRCANYCSAAPYCHQANPSLSL
jgi:hypothetical protein